MLFWKKNLGNLPFSIPQLLSPKQNFPLPRPPIGTRNIVLPSLIYSLFFFFSLGRKQMGHGVTLAGAFGRQRVALNELSQDEH